MRTSKSVARGISQVSLQNLEKLPSGIYMLEIADERSMAISVQKFVKN
jgi:hypothetical protein